MKTEYYLTSDGHLVVEVGVCDLSSGYKCVAYANNQRTIFFAAADCLYRPGDLFPHAGTTVRASVVTHTANEDVEGVERAEGVVLAGPNANGELVLDGAKRHTVLLNNVREVLVGDVWIRTPWWGESLCLP